VKNKVPDGMFCHREPEKAMKAKRKHDTVLRTVAALSCFALFCEACVQTQQETTRQAKTAGQRYLLGSILTSR